MFVDTHTHASPNWFQPVETLVFEMDRTGVEKAVLVQLFNGFDNSYVMDCRRRYPGRFAVAVNVDTARTDALDILGRLAAEGATGVRIRADRRSPGPDPLAIWRRASELHLTVSCAGQLNQMGTDDFRRLVETLPDLNFVLEHFGGHPLQYPHLVERLLALGKYPNVYLKFPGYGELLPRPEQSDTVPFTQAPDIVRVIYDAFGARHLMWGSDFPPSAAREGYTNALRLPMEKTSFFTKDDKEWIFGKTALSVWNI